MLQTRSPPSRKRKLKSTARGRSLIFMGAHLECRHCCHCWRASSGILASGCASSHRWTESAGAERAPSSGQAAMILGRSGGKNEPPGWKCTEPLSESLAAAATRSWRPKCQCATTNAIRPGNAPIVRRLSPTVSALPLAAQSEWDSLRRSISFRLLSFQNPPTPQ